MRFYGFVSGTVNYCVNALLPDKIQLRFFCERYDFKMALQVSCNADETRRFGLRWGDGAAERQHPDRSMAVQKPPKIFSEQNFQ